MRNKGFTLIEVLITTAIMAIVGSLMTGIFYTVTKVNQRETASGEVTSQLNFVTQTIQRLVRESSNIEIEAGTATTTLKLRMADSVKDPTCITFVSSTIRLAEGPDINNPENCTSNVTDLTNNKVTVDSLNFKKFTQYPGHDTVSFDIAMTYNSQDPAAQVQRTLQSAIARVSAATFDANLLPGDTSYTLGQVGSAWQNIIAADGTAANPSYTFGNSTGLGLFRAGTDILGFSTAGAERMRIDNAGNVGIGTMNPGNTLPNGWLDDADDKLVEINSVSDGDSGLFIRRAGTFTGLDIWVDNSAGPAFIDNLWNSATGRTDFRMRANDAGEILTVLSVGADGNVGIGTTLPVSKLVVRGDPFHIEGGDWYDVGALHLEPESGGDGVYDSPIISFGHKRTSDGWYSSVAAIGGIDDSSDNGSAGKLEFYTRSGADDIGDPNFSSKMTIKSTGNVGIGTSTPSTAKLVVVGTISASGPTEDYHVATREYVDAAGGGGLTWEGYTSSAFTGNLGGYKEANAKCENDYPGSHWASVNEIMRLGASYPYTDNIWVRDAIRTYDQAGNRTGYAGGTSINDGASFEGYCNGWKSAEVSYNGPVTRTTDGYTLSTACSNSRKLGCVSE